jgi:hypothetical protein
MFSIGQLNQNDISRGVGAFFSTFAICHLPYAESLLLVPGGSTNLPPPKYCNSGGINVAVQRHSLAPLTGAGLAEPLNCLYEASGVFALYLGFT